MAMSKNAAVNGTRYLDDNRKPSPREESSPAYAGQHKGQVTLGASDTATPGRMPSILFHIRRSLLAHRERREWGNRSKDHSQGSGLRGWRARASWLASSGSCLQYGQSLL